MGFLANKRALVIGVANDRSIAWGIAKQLHAQGAEVILTYQTDKLKSRVEAAAAELNSPAIFPLDATSDEQIA
ncbi:MAG: SDR family oxidoreductase, partial [Gammaproteobacteria bacterium]|nr:SDR family oxidoreductase [Gammaproteobacteria bacterium]